MRTPYEFKYVYGIDQPLNEISEKSAKIYKFGDRLNRIKPGLDSVNGINPVKSAIDI
jgi:hypothetical protein